MKVLRELKKSENGGEGREREGVEPEMREKEREE